MKKMNLRKESKKAAVVVIACALMGSSVMTAFAGQFNVWGQRGQNQNTKNEFTQVIGNGMQNGMWGGTQNNVKGNGMQYGTQNNVMSKPGNSTQYNAQENVQKPDDAKDAFDNTDIDKSSTSSASGNHVIEADGEEVSYSNLTVNKTGDGDGEEADFYGTNAAVFATNGATLTIEDSEITTNGKYANAVFSYGEGTTINISDSTITTSQRNSGGIMVTGGGELNAENLTITTEGGSSAAIRSDRGGGTMNVDGGSYTANGSGSPAVYSTADITVSNAKLKSGSAQAVVVEGGNKVTLNDCEVTGNNTVQNSDNSDYYQAVMLYQSMSGDAADGEGSFTMTGGSLTSLNGEMFFVTNAVYEINLNDVDLKYADENLLRICAAGWGNSGSNGGHVTLNAENQELEGNIIVDKVSELNMYLNDGSEFTGTFANKGEVNVEISEDSTWSLTGDCSISSLICEEDSINLNGHTLTVGGTVYTKENEAELEEEIIDSEEDPEEEAEEEEIIDFEEETESDSEEETADSEEESESEETKQDDNTVPEKIDDITKKDESVSQKPQEQSNNVPAKPANEGYNQFAKQSENRNNFQANIFGYGMGNRRYF